MPRYSLSHLADSTLLCDLATLIDRDRATTAELLAHLAEVDARKLYLPAAYPSMFAYCVGELRLSEDAAYRRIQAARLARKYPAIFDCLVDGRLHVSAVVILSAYITPENADDLLAAAAHRTKAELEELIARRFPRSEIMALVEALPATPPPVEEQPEMRAVRPDAATPNVTPPSCQLAPGRVEPCSKVAPLSPQRFSLHLTMGQTMHDRLRHAQELLGHSIPSGDIAQVPERALDALIEKLERQKLAATSRPRRTHRPSANPRHIPAHVKRAVWDRDGGQCTFVNESGRRCAARKFLEFDHVEPVARGGDATVGAIRLRCRAHNQYEAECTFGAEFMHNKRVAAAEARRPRAGGLGSHLSYARGPLSSGGSSSGADRPAAARRKSHSSRLRTSR